MNARARFYSLLWGMAGMFFLSVPFADGAQESGLSQAAKDAGEPYIRALQSAAQAYAARDFSKALDRLDMADQVHSDIPDTWNMRGAIYAEEHAFEKAEDAFEKAGNLNPGDFWPTYNLAELLLMEKKYTDAETAFKKLAVYKGHEELVQFKLVYTEILEGKADDAKAVLDAMKFPCDTAAYYYAHSAWGFAHKDAKDGNYWSNAGLKVFGVARCASYYDALVELGWLPKRNPDGSVPAESKLISIPGGTPMPAFAP